MDEGKESTGPRLAIGAILRNEGPYLLEWIAWHRVLGIGRFFLADNLSDDGSAALFAALDRAGIVSAFPFPGTPGEPPQLPAYAEILRRFGRQADWIAFIDADEFLLPGAPARSLLPLVAALDRPEVGAIAVNWAVYGSAGHLRAREGLVTERFPARAGRETPLNRHYKTILRPAAFAGTHRSPHLFRLRPGFRAVHADGAPVAPAEGRHYGLSRSVVWTPFRLNHYVVKSQEEFFRRKMLRGRATRNGHRDAVFFGHHDRNEAEDPPPPWLLAATRAEKARLLDALRETGWDGVEPPLLHPSPPPAPPPAPRWRGLLRFGAGKPRFLGHIDRLVPEGQVVRVEGWALGPSGAAMAAFRARAGTADLAALAPPERTERPDVARAHPGADPVSGFALLLPWETVEVTAPDPFSVLALDPSGERLALAPPDPEAWGRALRDARAAYAQVPEAPALPPAEAAVLAEALGNARDYLEYGAGGSTALALGQGALRMISAESDPLWRAAVEARLAGRLDPGRHHLAGIDIGPVALGGRPATEGTWRRFAAWPLEPWAIVEARGLAPDLVFVDGPFPLACLLASLLHAPEGARILLPGYAGRPPGRRGEAFARPRRTVGGLAEIVLETAPAARPRDTLWAALIAALADPC